MSQPQRSPRHRASVEALLSYAWGTAAFTASEAMDAIGASRSTTIEALDELVHVGLLSELPNARLVCDYRKGRPARRFELRADAGAVIGVDAGVGHLVTTVADLRGGSLARRTRTLELGSDTASTRRRLIRAEVDGALAQAGVGRSQVLSVCVGVPAPVNREGISPRHREGFWARMNPDLAELFSTWAPAVRVENDASLAAVAERTHGAAVGLANFVALLAGERLGAGVVVDGHLLRGAHGAVGELVVVRHLADVKASHGLGHQIADWARELVEGDALPAGHPLRALRPQEVSARVVVDLARAGDVEAVELVERAGAVVARISGVLASLYNPSRIIVAGGIAPGIEDALDVARRLLPDEADVPPPDLVASGLGADVVSIGAVAAALETARGHALAAV